METERLTFVPFTTSDLEWIYRYTSAYGEGSCQHSPVSMWSLSEKYGDKVCERDGFLYTLREKLCDDEYRVYLAPLGEGDKKAAYQNIFEDARAYGKKTKFLTLTETAAKLLETEFPEQFVIEENRDLAEYFYRTESMASFCGRRLKKRRSEVNTFWNTYGERAHVSRITGQDFPDILAFEEQWLSMNEETHDMDALRIEARMIGRQLENFDTLKLSGIVLRINGAVVGFGYGTKLSEEYYDAIIEKGDRRIPHVYKVLRQESVKQCAMDCKYVNMEEDVGLPGLRALKNSYQPSYLLHKFIAAERA